MILPCLDFQIVLLAVLSIFLQTNAFLVTKHDILTFRPTFLASENGRANINCSNSNLIQRLRLKSNQRDDDYFYDDDDSSLLESEDGSDFVEYSIDSFLRGEYDRRFADDAPAPHPGLTPQKTVESAVRSLRQLDDPEPSHGAAVLMRFCSPLSRNERWGDSRGKLSDWKGVLRGAITPSMLARRIRASKFSCLLDWDRLDVTEGTYSIQRDDGLELGVPSSVAYVSAALHFEAANVEPVLVQFTLRKINGVWLIDSAQLSQKDLFVANEGDDDKDTENGDIEEK